MTGATYIDVNDISEAERKSTKDFFFGDPAYIVLNNIGSMIPHGDKINRRFCTYVYKKDVPVCNIVLREYVDNPDGYSLNDFYFHKWVWPDFQHTKYARYALADLMHIIFMTHTGNNLYCYAPSKSDDEFFLDSMNMEILPCSGVRFPTDGLDVQKYIRIKKRFKVLSYPYVLIEMNGDIYRDMDLMEYFMAAPDRNEAIVRKWLEEMGEAARKVQDSVCSTD